MECCLENQTGGALIDRLLWEVALKKTVGVWDQNCKIYQLAATNLIPFNDVGLGQNNIIMSHKVLILLSISYCNLRSSIALPIERFIAYRVR